MDATSKPVYDSKISDDKTKVIQTATTNFSLDDMKHQEEGLRGKIDTANTQIADLQARVGEWTVKLDEVKTLISQLNK